ncbi:MAG: hypothetical protein M1324_04625 [Patescibacteria group bacterium]|nr:hypothetical protein [Patescibacteria group bacterium]
MKRTCKQVTISISKLKKAFHEFGSNLDSADSDNIKNHSKTTVDLKEMVLETQREVISPVRSFLKELEKPGVIEKIRAIVEQERGDGERFRLVSALFDKLPSGLIFDDTVYKDFLEEIGFDSNYATDIINECERISDDFNYDIINHLNSVFLNKFMKSDSVLTMDDLPPRLSYYGFGSYLEKGTIKLKNAKRGLGHGAKKTTFIAERTGDHPGVASQDCRFSIGEISGSIEELGRRTRIEYVYFQLHSCLKYSGGLMPYHPDSESTSWLLQKRISLDVGGVYFKANWLERAGAIAVDWSRENISLPNTGARFAVLPKSVQKYLTGETPLDIKLSNGDKQ